MRKCFHSVKELTRHTSVILSQSSPSSSRHNLMCSVASLLRSKASYQSVVVRDVISLWCSQFSNTFSVRILSSPWWKAIRNVTMAWGSLKEYEMQHPSPWHDQREFVDVLPSRVFSATQPSGSQPPSSASRSS